MSTSDSNNFHQSVAGQGPRRFEFGARNWNDHESALRKTFVSGALALMVLAYPACVSAQPVSMAGSPPKSEQSNKQTAEESFMVENQAAMSKMMKDMTVKPSGNVDADFIAMMIPHHQGAVDMAEAELHYGHNKKLRAISRNIIAMQRKQIGEMRAALDQPVSVATSSMAQSSPDSARSEHNAAH